MCFQNSYNPRELVPPSTGSSRRSAHPLFEPRTHEIRDNKNFAQIWLVEARFWEMNGVVNDILVLKMVAKIVFVQNHKFEILNPNPKPQSQILNPNPKSISGS